MADDGFFTLFIEVFKPVPWLFLILLMVLFIALNTDIFEDGILAKMDGTMEDGVVTGRGVVYKSMIFVFIAIIMDISLRYLHYDKVPTESTSKTDEDTQTL